ncbi:hypothetical protein CGRA01v4_14185 [Colletotrichum graminicola]|nr:hypothetical protein CGRA01v4_14185 [Colletotrichum graminicola]
MALPPPPPPCLQLESISFFFYALLPTPWLCAIGVPDERVIQSWAMSFLRPS